MSFRTKALGAGAAAVIAATAFFLEPLEGLVTKVYKDVAGVNTVCIGETQNIDFNKTYTPDECRALLHKRLPDYYQPVKAALKVEVPFETRVALTSLSYNVGPQTVINSTGFRLINAGQLQAGCYAFIMFRFAGGKDCTIPANKCMGLIKRRAQEIELCAGGKQ